MPSNDDGIIYPDNLKRNRTWFYIDEQDDLYYEPSPTDSVTTDILENGINPPNISEQSSWTTIATNSSDESNEVNIIPSYIFDEHTTDVSPTNTISVDNTNQLVNPLANEESWTTISSNSLDQNSPEEQNITQVHVLRIIEQSVTDHNRCIDFYALYDSQHFEGTEESSLASEHNLNVLMVEISSNMFDEFHTVIHHYIHIYEDPYDLINAIYNYIYELNERDTLIPEWLFLEVEETDEPPFHSYENVEDINADKIIPDHLAGGDSNDTENIIQSSSKETTHDTH